MTAPSDKQIGRATCPLCKRTGAHLRLSVKQLPYILCEGCKCQIFARGDESDQLCRDLLTQDSPPPSPAPAPEPAPVPAAKPATKPEPAPAPTPTPEPEPTPAPAPKPSWGMFS